MMGAVFRREFSSHIRSMGGTLFLAATLLLCGVFTYVVNLTLLRSDFEYSLDSIALVFLAAVPLLCASTFAAEKNGGDRLLLSLPLSNAEIVLGKYLAMLAYMLIPCAAMSLIPPFLAAFGDVNMASSYTGIFAFVLCGASLLAIGMFVSSLFTSVSGAAVASFAVTLTIYLSTVASSLLPSSAVFSFVVILVAAISVCAFVIFVMKLPRIGAVIGALGCTAATVCYFVVPSAFEGLIIRGIGFFSVYDRMSDMLSGIFSLSDVVYYLTVIALFLYLTSVSFALRRRGSVSFRALACGGKPLQALTMLLAVTLSILLNSIFAALPATWTDFDVTGMNAYSLTDGTKKIMSSLDEDVTAYYIAPYGDENILVEEMLRRYDALSDRLKVRQIDPYRQPSFVASYTDEELPEHSVIFVSEKRFRVVSYDQILQVEIDHKNETYEYLYYGEECFTSAIGYVTAEKIPVVYFLSGHGEGALDDTFSKYLDEAGFILEELSLLKSGEIPDDADCIVILSPDADISDDEEKLLEKYISAGGKVLMTSACNVMPDNIASLAAACGMSAREGYLYDDAFSVHLSSWLVPRICEHAINKNAASSGIYVSAHTSHAIEIDEKFSYGEVTPLLVTGKSAYIGDSSGNAVGEKGQFTIGAVCEMNGGGALVWYGCEDIFNSEYDLGANGTLMVDTLSYLTGEEGSFSVSAVSLSLGSLYVTGHTARVAAFVMIGLIPLLVIGCVIVVRVRRNRR